MKKLFFIVVITFLLSIFSSCDKEKTNQEKIIGNWRRELINGMGGQMISVDTVLITSSTIKIENSTYNYTLKGNTLYYIIGADTNSFCFEFLSESNMKWSCFISPNGNYFNLIKY